MYSDKSTPDPSASNHHNNSESSSHPESSADFSLNEIHRTADTKDPHEIKSLIIERAHDYLLTEDLAGYSLSTVTRHNDSFHALAQVWRSLPRLEKAQEKALWTSFQDVWDAFRTQQHSFYAHLDMRRIRAAQEKESLIRQAELLSTSQDWSETTLAYKSLLKSWKRLGKAHAHKEGELWLRFKAANDDFFNAKRAAQTLPGNNG